MASPFKRTASVNVGTSPVDVFTVAASKVYTLIDCSCSNVYSGLTEVTATVQQVMGGTTAHLVKAGPVPVGSAMVVVGAPRKVVFVAGDILRVTASVASGVDCTVSYLEQDA